MKVAIYARVSTDRQTVENQLIQLRKWVEGNTHELVDIYLETESGGERRRPVFRRMLEDAFKHKFDAILVYALDRFTREGISETLNYLTQLKSYNIKFISYTEPLLSTLQPEIAEVVYAVLAFVAKLERTKISERTKAGLERARAKGKQIGRKATYEPEKLLEMKAMVAMGVKDSEIARALGIKNPASVAHARKKILPYLEAEIKIDSAITPSDQNPGAVKGNESVLPTA